MLFEKSLKFTENLWINVIFCVQFEFVIKKTLSRLYGKIRLNFHHTWIFDDSNVNDLFAELLRDNTIILPALCSQ